jgi:hypothetical protein
MNDVMPIVRPLFHAAVQYAGSGLSVIPTGSARHVDEARRKKAVIAWKPYQERIAKPEEIRRLFRDESQLAIALITGSVSGNLEVLDFDKPELFPLFMESLRIQNPALVGRLIIQKTPSGGFHLLYKCKDPVPGNQKLAMSRRYQDQEGKPRQEVFIETRGEGGYFLVSPSEGYDLQGDIKNIPTIGSDERALLIRIAKGFDEGTEPERQQRKATPTEQTGDRPGDVLERVADWRTLLEADGWRYFKTIGDREHWSRPGKDPASSSATLNEMGLYVFSSNTPLPTETPLGKLAYVAHFRHNGDFKAAARWVVEAYTEEFPKNTSDNRMTDREEPPWPDDSEIDMQSRQSSTDSTTLDNAPRTRQPLDTKSTETRQKLDNDRILAKDVLSFIEMDPEPFTNNDVYSELCIRTRREKNTVCAALYQYEKQGKIRKIEGKRGSWEIVEDRPKTMDLLSVDTKPFKISLPLEISDYVNVRPGGIILVSGSNNAGKTVFLLWVVRNFISLHTNPHLSYESKGVPLINYLNSEMSPQELVARIRSFGDDPADWVKHVSFIERSHSFDRIVVPDGINLIDFLEVNEDFFQAGKLIADIHKKLKSGIAIIAMQKRQGYAFAKGGEMTLEKPRLAINLDKNEPHGFTCKVTKAKEAVDFNRNIQGMTRDFVITGDSKILPISDWRHVNEKQRFAINAEYDRNNIPRRVLESGQHYKVV